MDESQVLYAGTPNNSLPPLFSLSCDGSYYTYAMTAIFLLIVILKVDVDYVVTP